jgi:hypothetical protein
MTEEQKRIEQLEKEVKDLRELFDSLFKGSNPTRLYLKYQVAYDKQSLVGFFGKDPVKQQTLASDTLANLLTALRTLGLIS